MNAFVHQILSSPYLNYLLAFVIPSVLVFWMIPNIRYVALKKRIIDKPSGRKQHVNSVSNLGGLAIYIAVIIALSFCRVTKVFPAWDYIFAASFILFFTGIKDDVLAIKASHKFVAEFIAAFIVVCFADIRLDNLYGFMGIHQLPYVVSLLLTVVGIVFVTNAYNLIDGVDGLCGSLTVFQCLVFTYYFSRLHIYGLATMSIAIGGALMGFLYYNKPAAKIFMGDSGSLLLGFFMSILSIAMVNNKILGGGDYRLSTGKEHLALTLSIMIVPVFDAIRVFGTRIAHGKGPFVADRRHVHHLLLDSGFNAWKVDAILLLFNLIVVLATIFLYRNKLNATIIIFLQIVISFTIISILMWYRNHKQRLLHGDTKVETDTKVSDSSVKMTTLGEPIL